jgi:hypothetical protein
MPTTKERPATIQHGQSGDLIAEFTASHSTSSLRSVQDGFLHVWSKRASRSSPRQHAVKAQYQVRFFHVSAIHVLTGHLSPQLGGLP